MSYDSSTDQISGFSRPREQCFNETFDGQIFNIACETVLFKHHFYLSEERYIFKFIRRQFIDFLAQIGGLFKLMVFVFSLVVFIFNERNMILKRIASMYFVKKDTKHRSSSVYDVNEEMYEDLRIMKVGLWDKIINLKVLCCRKKNIEKCEISEKTINIGETKL